MLGGRPDSQGRGYGGLFNDGPRSFRGFRTVSVNGVNNFVNNAENAGGNSPLFYMARRASGGNVRRFPSAAMSTTKTDQKPRRARKEQTAVLPGAGGSERVAPHNLDAEQGLLASIILEGGGDILTQCQASKIRPEYFFSTAHQVIYEAALELNMDGKSVDEITLPEMLHRKGELAAAGGPAYINELTRRIEVTAHAVHWMEIVREKYFRRKLITTATGTVEKAFSPGDSIDQLLEAVERSFFEITQDKITDSAKHVAGPLKEAVVLMNTLINSRGAITGVPTGLVDLDKMTYGFHPGQMIVVAARPGMGKTSIALNFIEAALFDAKKKTGKAIPVLMFSLEMPARELALRLMCSRAGVNLRKLSEGFVNRESLADIASAEAEYRDMPLFIDDAGGQNILEIRAKSRRLHAQHKLGMIVIDYIQLINGTDSSVAREQQIAEASRAIKAMAKEFGIPVVALAQLNRKSEDEARQPRMSDLRESGSIEQDADVVLLISRPTGKTKDDEEVEVGPGLVKRELIIAKQRSGPTGEIPLYFNRALTKFVTPEKQPGPA